MTSAYAFSTSNAVGLPSNTIGRPSRTPAGRRQRARASPRPSAARTSMSSAPTEDMTTSDWRAFRARLVATQESPGVPQAVPHGLSIPTSMKWAHAIPTPEVGACVITTLRHDWPDSFAHLRRAVILLTHVSKSGVQGILLNRPTRYTVRTHRSVLSRVGSEFCDNRVMLGGDCSTGSLEVVHPFSPDVCQGACEIVPGVSKGGFNAARVLVRERRVNPFLFSFFVAYSKWSVESFDAELKKGAWNIVACSPSMLFSPDGLLSDNLWATLNAYV